MEGIMSSIFGLCTNRSGIISNISPLNFMKMAFSVNPPNAL